MDRYLVVHDVREGITQDQIYDSFQRVAAVAGPAKWQRSYYLPKSNQMICDWEAPDEASIRTAIRAAEVESLAPIKSIQFVVYADPDTFK
jgi:hypothetical protein